MSVTKAERGALVDLHTAAGQLSGSAQRPMTPEEVAAIAVALLAGSELLSYMPGIRANGWVQLVLAALKGIAAAAEGAGNDKKRGRRR